ncbi:MAG: PilZ domain-containing protein [Candidatus Omnitrophica bacterium]|nr:PilZ domain-containing protein [Candidatus Omnitrophota bacterium]MBU4457369.1 PilZ domain-containing protein [Candidatus Omnitrophota bacterium]
MREKRRFIRFDIALKVNYIVQKEPRAEKTGITKDVSAGGLQLLTEEKLEPGRKIAMKISIPEALNPVHLNGIVLWSRESPYSKARAHGIGIEFAKIEEDNKNTFLKFLCDLLYGKIGKKKESS